MTPNYDEILASVAGDTAMSLAFLLPMSEDEAVEVPDYARRAAIVEFSGPFSGALFVVAPEEALPELTANMLGLDDPSEAPDAETQRDALKELLNVICGNLLPEIAGADAVFKVHAPELLDGHDAPDRFGQADPAGTARLFLDTGVLELSLYVDSPATV